MQLRLSGFIILLLFLLGCHPHYTRQEQRFTHYALKDQPDESRMNDSIAGYKRKVTAETARVIAVSSDDLVRDGAVSSMGVFVCDALKYAAGQSFGASTDIVLLNKGGLRNNIAKGDVTVAQIFELMPFENEMVMLTVTGKDLYAFARFIPEKRHPYSGLVIRLMKDSVVFVKVKNEVVDPDKSYEIITSDYLANGGDNFSFLSGLPMKASGVKVRDAIISYCEYLTSQNKMIKPYRDARLEISK